MNTELASDQTKTALENSVGWFLSEQLGSSNLPMATVKFLTHENILFFLTKCQASDSSAPRVKVQIFSRVPGGVRESNYQLFMDHKFTRTDNDMIFGVTPSYSDATADPVDVSEAEALHLLVQVNNLVNVQKAS